MQHLEQAGQHQQVYDDGKQDHAHEKRAPSAPLFGELLEGGIHSTAHKENFDTYFALPNSFWCAINMLDLTISSLR
jgi:hypothetical protein